MKAPDSDQVHHMRQLDYKYIKKENSKFGCITLLPETPSEIEHKWLV